MSKKLYVGNLPYTASEEDLRKLFGEFGTLTSVSIIIDRETGRSKGFAFVEFEDDAAALKAIDARNGYKMDDRPLTVNEARPREERPSNSFRGGQRSGGYGNRYSQAA